MKRKETMMAGRKPAPIPVTLIGGFLGAGKTTLLNHILSENHGVRAAVLVNDFGAINIDAKLVVGVEGETVTLANGCVCCTIRDDLIGACLGLLQRSDPPEHLLIELSGVSDPVPVLNTFLETELGTIFSFSTILSIVDAEQLPELKDEMGDLARAQIQAADIVVLNKVDLVSAEDLAGVKQRVHDITPGSRIIEVSYGRVPMGLVFADGYRPSRTPRRGGSHDHEHHPPVHPFATWDWTSERPLSLPRLRSTLEALPDSVYRCKGIVYLEELPVFRYVLQMVGKRYHLDETGPWGEELPRSEIVLIGGRNGIDGDSLQDTFDGCVGTGDETQSPILRLVRKIAPELLADHLPERRDAREPTPDFVSEKRTPCRGGKGVERL
jgi:G3E family GTPase